MLFSAYKELCLEPLKQHFCVLNFDLVVIHLNYIKKEKTDSWDHVVMNEKAKTEYLEQLEKQFIDNFNQKA